MRTESPQEFVVWASRRGAIPRYLIYFAMPPVTATFVLLAIEPMAGMTLLACFVVMWIVVRAFISVVPRQSEPPGASDRLFPDLAIDLVDPAGTGPTDHTYDAPLSHRRRAGAKPE